MSTLSIDVVITSWINDLRNLNRSLADHVEEMMARGSIDKFKLVATLPKMIESI
jgi:hypothetical protein